MEEILALILSQLLEAGIKYTIKKKVDEVGNNISQLVQLFDDDGDGEFDREEVIYTIESLIPDLSGDYCIVNNDDGKIGIGVPALSIVDNTDMADLLDDVVAGTNNGVIVDADIYVPLNYDTTGDGVNDWGKLIDSDDNGIPDAASDTPFYPVGSDGYNRIVNSRVGESGVDIVLVSSDGEIAVYDRNGNIKPEDVDTAYATWVSKNGIMNKPFDNYSVTEGLLLLTFIVSLFAFFSGIFRKRRVMR